MHNRLALTIYIATDYMSCTTSTIACLHFVLDSTMQLAHAVTSHPQQQHTSCIAMHTGLMLSKLDTFLGYEHKIKPHTNTYPAPQNVCTIPIANHDKAKLKINKVVEQGIWEPCSWSD